MHNQEAFSAGKAGAIIVAAGSGSRLGGAVPKQFQPLGGKPMLLWSVEAMLRCNKIAAIVVVVPPGEEDRARAISCPGPGTSTSSQAAPPGPTRSARGSTRLRRRSIPTSVLIHDAARPGLTPDGHRGTARRARDGRRRRARPARRRRPQDHGRRHTPLRQPRRPHARADPAGLPLDGHHRRLRTLRRTPPWTISPSSKPPARRSC